MSPISNSIFLANTITSQTQSLIQHTQTTFGPLHHLGGKLCAHGLEVGTIWTHGPKLVYYTFGNFDMKNVHGHRSNSPATTCKQLGGVEMAWHIYSYARCNMPGQYRPKLVMYKKNQSRHVAKSQRVITQVFYVTCKKLTIFTCT